MIFFLVYNGGMSDNFFAVIWKLLSWCERL